MQRVHAILADVGAPSVWRGALERVFELYRLPVAMRALVDAEYA